MTMILLVVADREREAAVEIGHKTSKLWRNESDGRIPALYFISLWNDICFRPFALSQRRLLDFKAMFEGVVWSILIEYPCMVVFAEATTSTFFMCREKFDYYNF